MGLGDLLLRSNQDLVAKIEWQHVLSKMKYDLVVFRRKKKSLSLSLIFQIYISNQIYQQKPLYTNYYLVSISFYTRFKLISGKKKSCIDNFKMSVLSVAIKEF